MVNQRLEVAAILLQGIIAKSGNGAMDFAQDRQAMIKRALTMADDLAKAEQATRYDDSGDDYGH